MLESECDLKMLVRNLGYLLSLKIEGPKTTFLWRLSNLTANLTAYIFGTKHDIDNRISALETTRVSYIVSNFFELWSTNGLIWTRVLTHHLWILHVTLLPGFAEGGQQTELNGWKYIALTICLRKVGSPLPKTSGPKIFIHLFVLLSMTSRLNGEYVRDETWYRQSDNVVENYKVLLQLLKISWTLVHKQVKIGPEFSPTLCKFCVLLHCHASHTEVSKRNSYT